MTLLIDGLRYTDVSSSPSFISTKNHISDLRKMQSNDLKVLKEKVSEKLKGLKEKISEKLNWKRSNGIAFTEKEINFLNKNTEFRSWTEFFRNIFKCEIYTHSRTWSDFAYGLKSDICPGSINDNNFFILKNNTLTDKDINDFSTAKENYSKQVKEDLLDIME